MYSDSLRAGRSEDQIQVGARFSAPVQTGPVSHPDSYTMGTETFSGAKRPRRGFDLSTSSRAEVKERVVLYLYSPSGLSWTVLRRTLTFTSMGKGSEDCGRVTKKLRLRQY